MQREDWISEVLESTKGMQRAEPSPFLFEQITAKLANGTANSGFYGSPFLRWGLVVFVSVLVSINIIALLRVRSPSNEVISERSTSSDSYFNNQTIYTY